VKFIAQPVRIYKLRFPDSIRDNMLGWPEILLILMVMLLIFGPSKLPEMARSLGQAFKEFQNAYSTLEKETKTLTDQLNLPDLNASLQPGSSILRKPLNSGVAPVVSPTVATKTSSDISVVATSEKTQQTEPITPKGNIAEAAKALGIDVEGKSEEDLKIAIQDKIDGLDMKEV
jgi:sec-independent protein translocase protein TatA